ETLELVAGAAAGAAARLKFFRAALGPAASSAQSVGMLRDLIDNYLGTQVSAASPGISFAWSDAPASVNGATARLLLNLVLLAKDALPRGGTITASIGAAGPQVVARGEPSSLSDEARQVLVDNCPPSGPRGAQAEFARVLAAQSGGSLHISLTSEGTFLAVVPAGSSTPSEGGLGSG
ncbi:MAG TPA: histidine phosphotransferase family protein, partial [Candidatus Sulfotelmatobacter sp.]|nr:histidine phosphotransferase family protein [Candidatus Sulfotelmatobacter sp.]